AIKSAKGPTVRTSAGDMRITTAVKLRLLTTAQIPSTEISVDTDDGLVTLFGEVPTMAVKKAAQLEAAKVSGVDRVENNIEPVLVSMALAYGALGAGAVVLWEAIDQVWTAVQHRLHPAPHPSVAAEEREAIARLEGEGGPPRPEVRPSAAPPN